MGKGHRTCEVCGIKERHTSGEPLLFSKFPLDPNRCREWLKAVGNEELVYLPLEKLHDQRNICAKHFQRKYFNRKGNRLKRHAIPTLGLMAVPLTDAQLAPFPMFVGSDKIVSTPKHAASVSTSQQNILELSQNVSMPQHTASLSTSQQKRDVLMELSQNVSMPKHAALASTSQQNVMELPQNVSMPKHAALASTSQKNVMELPQNVSMPKHAALASTSQQNVMELPQNVSMPKHAALASTSQQNVMELSQNVQTLTETLKRTGVTIENKEKRRKTSEELKKSVSVPDLTTQKESQSHLEAQYDLTPRKKKLLKKLRKTKCTLMSLKKSANLIEKIESTVLKEIVTSAIKNQKRKPQGRRWTTKNKISALAIFKRSPKGYRYLRHFIPLPTVKTLQNVLKKMPMEPGINKAVIDHLKIISAKKSSIDKYCGLVFDEIALKRRVLYNTSTDKVEGYQDVGSGDSGRSVQLADHALVFMLQGIRAKFKQPIAFYFVKGTISSQKLASLIKEIINAVHDTGFQILTTICDQGPTNMGALKILKTTSPPHDQNNNYFMCDDKRIFIMYDVPHLFKSIRNNFYNYGELHMSGMKAQWAHLLKVEEKNRQLLYLSKISQMHVQPKYKAKMKVKYAAQILSNTVAAVLKLTAQAEKDAVKAAEIMQTGEIVHDLDRLFDMTNGPSCPDDVKKGRRENVSAKTEHLKAWTEYRAKLESVKFKKPNGVTAKHVRCIEGYITTLRSLRDIWGEVSRLGFKYLNLRQLNQDALENLFGVIRQHSPTNRNPTCQSFVAALKTSIISGMTAPHNRGSNCEKDYKKLLTDFHDQLFENPQNEPKPPQTEYRKTDTSNQCKSGPAEISDEEFPVFSISEEFEEIETDLSDMKHQPLVYVAGYIASRVLKNNNCEECKIKIKIEDPEDDPVFSYIKLREWWKDKQSLTYPTKELCHLIEAATKIFESDVLPCLHYINISKLAVTLFMAKCDSSFLTCNQHSAQVLEKIYFCLAVLLIRRQCQRQNQELSLEEELSADANKKAQQQGIAK